MAGQTRLNVRPIKIRREGKSLVIAVPPPVIEELMLKAGDWMVIIPQDGAMVGRKVNLNPVLSKMVRNGEK
jgi:antitoxin component of MazEF toxin-antitoxin module